MFTYSSLAHIKQKSQMNIKKNEETFILCSEEKYRIVTILDSDKLMNKKFKVVTKCWYENRYMLYYLLIN